MRIVGSAVFAWFGVASGLLAADIKSSAVPASVLSQADRPGLRQNLDLYDFFLVRAASRN